MMMNTNGGTTEATIVPVLSLLTTAAEDEKENYSVTYTLKNN